MFLCIYDVLRAVGAVLAEKQCINIGNQVASNAVFKNVFQVSWYCSKREEI